MNVKKKLMAATAMLMVSTIMLTSASFAWFTISTAPEISNMTTQVVVNDNLEIALATDATTQPSYLTPGAAATQITWGNIVDLNATDVSTDYAKVNKTLRPATLGTNKFQAPEYGADGRPGALKDLTIGITEPYGTITDGKGLVYGYYVDVWLKSNKAGTVTLADANTKRSSEGAAGKGAVFTSENQTLADNVAVAIQPMSGDTITAMTAGTPTSTAAEGKTTYTTTFDGNVVTLAANTAQRVRIYVYLEGAAVSNAAASLSGENGTISGALNLQFSMTNITTSMDKAETTT